MDHKPIATKSEVLEQRFQARIELWESFTSALALRGCSDSRQRAIDVALASQFLIAHYICGQDNDGHPDRSTTFSVGDVRERLDRDLRPLCESVGATLSTEIFGHCQTGVGDRRLLLGVWSVAADLITTAPEGSHIEINLGLCGRGLELEVGYDAVNDEAETARGALSVSAAEWLAAICPDWEFRMPSCPLGGRAIQLVAPVPRNLTADSRAA